MTEDDVELVIRAIRSSGRKVRKIKRAVQTLKSEPSSSNPTYPPCFSQYRRDDDCHRCPHAILCLLRSDFNQSGMSTAAIVGGGLLGFAVYQAFFRRRL